MLRTYNYTGRNNLDKQDIKITPHKMGFRFIIDRLDEFPPDSQIIFFAKTGLSIERIMAGTVQEISDENHPDPCKIKDLSILQSDNIKIDVHIVGHNRKILSRTDDIYIGTPIEKFQNSDMLGFKKGDTGHKLYEIEPFDKQLVVTLSKKIDNFPQIFKNRNIYETAILLPNIIKDAYIHALIVDESFDYKEEWQKQLSNISGQEIDDETEPSEIMNAINIALNKLSQKLNVINHVKEKL